MAAFQHAYPGFLKEIFRQLPVSAQVQQILEQPVLILLDQRIEQFGIALPQPVGYGFGVIGHEDGKTQPDCLEGCRMESRAHSTGYTRWLPQKTHGQRPDAGSPSKTT